MMNFPDLTVDGSFTLGAAVLAKLLSSGQSVYFSLFVAAVSGFLAGAATASLNRYLGISKILSGILIMLILYSINLRIMGKANISLLRISTIFTPFERYDATELFLVGIVISFLITLCYFSITKIGLFIRATGDNEFMVRSQGVDTSLVYIIGIGIANMLVAFAGGIIAQNQGFADISMGIGLIITVLAALIIGESFLSFFNKIATRIFTANKMNVPDLPWSIFGVFIAATLGSFMYYFIIAVCMQLGLPPTDLKLATGILVIVGLSLQLNNSQANTHLKEQF